MRGLCYLILSILSRVYGSTVRVVGVVGHNVTLPCAYDALSYGSLSFCWGKDAVPTFRCSNTIFSWTGGAPQSRWGPRYQLRGSLDEGDVSMTITSTDWSDAGVYGCRVEIPGPFNDLKVNIKLEIEEAPEEEPTVSPSYTQQKTEGSAPPLFDLTAEAHVLRTITEKELDLLSFLGVENMGRLAAVLLVTIILILLFIFWRRLLPPKAPEQSETSAPENVYESIPLH
ncbi:T-cell immunoglobulin and mucin domain-containing protein 4-like [Periophthalmus magnuspinnatus]|uniref:T-cell immunoglobulin and mucin domain-containing protein 4-like n=1 Tax=Periophthalmus magnuspinnatus TaxID=409849 RepID=UPI00145BB9C2|nr:T-cell immunoglobulin and mucin domain-containing protein 4-like [Periophthalmus magnuspinnatus]